MESRETAWSSWEEWQQVRKLLYSFDDINMLKNGVHMVNAWRSRLRVGALPVSVELTASLIASYLVSVQHSDTDDHLRLSIAMALVRFVNGITDQLQTGLYAQSVQLIADKINIPDWLVDLRHQATHSQLPGVEVLQSGLMVALTWLEENYWEETSVIMEEKFNAQHAGIKEGLANYVALIIHVNSDESKKDENFKLRKKNEKKCSDQCTDISKCLSKNLHNGNLKIFISHFLAEGNFVPDQDILRSLGMKYYKFRVDADDDIFSKIDILVEFWKPLFAVLTKQFSSFVALLSVALSLRFKTSKTEDLHNSYLISMYMLYKIDKLSLKHFMPSLVRCPSHFGFQILRVMLRDENNPNNNFTGLLGVFMTVTDSLQSTQSVDEVTKRIYLDDSANFKKSYDILQKLKPMQHENKSSDTSSARWKTLDENELLELPPMGEFKDIQHKQYLDLSKHPVDINENENVMENENMGVDSIENILTGESLTKSIDHLFTDDVIRIPDYDSSNCSDETDEYRLEKEALWDVDFKIGYDSLAKTEEEEQSLKNIFANIEHTNINFF